MSRRLKKATSRRKALERSRRSPVLGLVVAHKGQTCRPVFVRAGDTVSLKGKDNTPDEAILLSFERVAPWGR